MIIQSSNVWICGQFMPAQIEISGSKITDIRDIGEKEPNEDYGDLRIVPGFIDIHTHGYYGWDTNDATPEGLRRWLKEVPAEGVTGLCPTTITQSMDVLSKALKNAATVAKEDLPGAEILGIHLEGPFLDNVYKGAQPEQYIIRPDVEIFKTLQKEAEGMIKVITMACEHDEGYRLTEYCASHGVLVSQGHSGTTYAGAVMACAHGASSMTHVYNGMSGFKHREPGLVGAALRLSDCYGEVICDGNHSDINALRIFYNAKGKDHAVMVSDSLNLKGYPAGTRILFGGNEIEIVPDGSAHLVSTGGLAGSTLRINRGLALLVQKAGVPFDAALNSCTLNPARALRIDDRKGRIRTGYDADITVLDDNYEVVQTYARGRKCL
ncbi:MAG: N-acetylglucosamine-6-phosphate deacetylase [Erysipelotrichaceae bacterium]|nr:N-acetylglucosamine-6-phosphate deacetylase [Erysipelotrichaceae bacterium]